MSASSTSSSRRRSPAGRLGELPAEERPREKLLARGAAALSDEELLALLLGTGTRERPVLETARGLLAQGGGGFRGLFAHAGQLKALSHGIGAAKEARLLAVLEIASRVSRAELAERPLLGDPALAARHLMTLLLAETREVFGGLFLDAKNRLLSEEVVFRGATTHTAVSPSPLFRIGILVGAVGVVLFHNHPSGDPEPSVDDVATTRRFVAAGREIGIEVRDHLVIGRGRYASFHERGLL